MILSEHIGQGHLAPVGTEPERSCYACSHNSVCGIYRAWKAMMGLGGPSPLNPTSEDFSQLSRFVAGICTEFRPAKEEAENDSPRA